MEEASAEQITSQEPADAEQFLTDIAPHLQERCVVQTVGHDKARFPLLARQDAVSANGKYYGDSLDWGKVGQACDGAEG
ncbi:hypothetical protein [Halorientalis regularis]|uniref:hypothetical protein n=1 Tax=Halorientalis regularis TaxID=660518 RepID=UPI001113D088|nr:hypothetical protein [Halorientalis regularis]